MAQDGSEGSAKEDAMTRYALLATLPLLLSACGARSYSDAWEVQKARCTAPDFEVCAQIAYAARDAMGGPTQPQQPFVLSQPIID